MQKKNQKIQISKEMKITQSHLLDDFEVSIFPGFFFMFVNVESQSSLFMD